MIDKEKQVGVIGRFIGVALQDNKKFAVFMDCIIDGEKKDKNFIAMVDADELIVVQAPKHIRDNFFKIGKAEGKSDKQIQSEFIELCKMGAACEYPDYINPPTIEKLRKKYNIGIPE